jgi:hypothetical protein
MQTNAAALIGESETVETDEVRARWSRSQRATAFGAKQS